MPDIRIMSLLLLAATLPLSAIADEGVLEINQACAEGSGCFSGDSAGFPVEINSPGSYALTGSLDVPSGVDGISVNADNVRIDLGGFVLRGPVSCTGTPPTCDDAGFDSGVDAGAQSGVVVHGGAVIGFAGNGIDVGPNGSAFDLKTTENGSNGVGMVGPGRAYNIESYRNEEDGFLVGDGTELRDVMALDNGRDGIDTGNYATVSGATVRGNADRGINALSNNRIKDVIVSDNGDEAGDFGIILFNGNGYVADSTVNGNADYGIQCSSGGESALRNLVLQNNNQATVGTTEFNGTCTQLATSLCNNSPCP